MKEFHIKQNTHNTWGLHHLGFTFKDKISFKAEFDESCLYDLESVNNLDINKLFGFSTTLWHHNQSARVGWRRHGDDSIELLTYSYDNKKRIYQTLGIVKPDQEFTCTIEDIETHYVYTFNDGNTFKKVSDPKLGDKLWFKYFLWPYFGGDQTAPQNMLIYLERI
jgi:hypothetical protein